MSDPRSDESSDRGWQTEPTTSLHAGGARARMWAYRGVTVKLNLFDFTVSRHRDGPELFFADRPWRWCTLTELADELRNLRLIQEAERQADSSATVKRGALRIRCPHCHNPVEVLDDTSLSDVVCSSCGSHFNLVSDEPQTFPADQLETVGQFKLLDKLGVGAFGSVWSARDTELDRMVAVKIPRKGQLAAEDTERFLREARATAQLNHPNIVRVYEVGREGDRVYIVTDCVQGADLADWLAEHRPRPREAAELCAKLADALHHAHEHGVIHRDLKPSNIMLDSQGEPHLMDFGLAKREAGEITMTVEGKLLGTPAYMSPEQARGSAHDADRRSDVYSLGVILFELLTGQRPFRGTTRMLLQQVLAEDAPRLRGLNRDIPKDLETICLRCLEKDPGRRYQTAALLRDDLQRYLRGEPLRARPISRPARAWRWCRKNPALAILGAGCLAGSIVLSLIGHRYYREQQDQQRENWARYQVLPQSKRLFDQGDIAGAFQVARAVEEYLPDDPMLLEMWPRITRNQTVLTDPPGAEVFFREYSDTSGRWLRLGVTPIQKARFPYGFYRWRIEKPGYETFETCGGDDFVFFEEVTLVRWGTQPPGMVLVPGGELHLDLAQFESIKPIHDVPAYWIDRCEVTNRQFKEFVKRGGYRNHSYWTQPLLKEGKTLTFEDALSQFVDQTGRPGPATWQRGTYPEGQADYPVTGVSWYEAAAYAEFAGKRLPTIFHWSHTAGLKAMGRIALLSNMEGKHLAPVGSYPGISPNGVCDMAGNAREWCFNENREFDGQRFILGGSFGEPRYMFIYHASLSPWNRSGLNGFRCVRLPDEQRIPNSLFASVGPTALFEGIADVEPISEESFKTLKSEVYDYDRTTPLSARLEGRLSSSIWLRETITLDAVYGDKDERVAVHLFLPRAQGVEPPYQVVVYFPHTYPDLNHTFERLEQANSTEFIIESGRALVFPIYFGSYERSGRAKGRGKSRDRELMARASQDMRRTIDYLQTREDIDADRIAYYGCSTGAMLGPCMMAVEDRFRCGMLNSGGLYPYFLDGPLSIRPYNFAPRVKAPLLMLNGRYAPIFPLQASQKRLFDLLRTPPDQKKHTIYECGHSLTIYSRQWKREVLDWLDTHLGSVARRVPSQKPPT